jgi:hypothetical protein
VEGQLWYNSTAGSYKIAINAGGTWSTSTAVPAGSSSWAGAGTTTAALAWGGTPFDNIGNDSWEYDGSSWTAGGTMTTILGGNAGLGTQTAALGVGGHNGGGYQSDSAMEYNGSTWTAVTADPASSAAIRATAGIQTAGMTVGGYWPAVTNVTSLWSGSAWTTGGVYPISKTGMSGTGIETAALVAGGSPYVTTANTYDGTSWTAIPSLSTARGYMCSAGTTTVNIMGGGRASGDTSKAITESYDGSSWTEVGDLGTARKDIAQGWAPGSSNLGVLAMGGTVPPHSTLVEEWTNPVYSTKTVTTS